MNQHGFEFGYATVTRIASNDGADKRKSFNVVRVTGPNGEFVDIVVTKEGIHHVTGNTKALSPPVQP